MNTPARLQMPLIYDEEIGSIQDSSGLSLFITDELTEKRSGNDLHKIGQWMVDFINEAHDRDPAPALEVGLPKVGEKHGNGYATADITHVYQPVRIKYIENSPAQTDLTNDMSLADFHRAFPTKLPAESPEGSE